MEDTSIQVVGNEVCLQGSDRFTTPAAERATELLSRKSTTSSISSDPLQVKALRSSWIMVTLSEVESSCPERSLMYLSRKAQEQYYLLRPFQSVFKGHHDLLPHSLLFQLMAVNTQGIGGEHYRYYIEYKQNQKYKDIENQQSQIILCKLRLSVFQENPLFSTQENSIVEEKE